MKIAIGCDHGGLLLKDVILPLLAELGHEVYDQGTDSPVSVDYPHYAKAVCHLVANEACDLGILICGTGIGMSMAANRNKKIRAALCTDMYSARMSREHNNANVLCLGARVIGPGLAEEIVRTWLATAFAGERHLRRIEMF
ncbi:MAG: ribose 5-phosphate isomerase B [Deltaproteobacteria bacterium]|nr:ribose 5-phosphate isomerase B [Deltaproteobacteria bacterium]